MKTQKILTRIGELEVSEESIIHFEEGIPGFEKLKNYVIVERPESEPIKWLVSIDEPEIILPVINPWLIRVDYDVKIDEGTVQMLDIKSREDVLVVCILVIPKDRPKEMTINLLAPIVINTKSNLARQIIMDGSGYRIKHRVVEELERSRKLVEENSGKKNGG
ncbi:MAG: flagellar assembly factor FliW [Thermotogaceae bacterium]|nr:flagellar assembly factor FliW [Thermotogaceae bacterium]MDN5338485.1 flagellar assembly factor FliW [Thermotogaceae bacterium]